MILVDTNVLIDVVENDPDWAEWAIGQLDAAVQRGVLIINPVIYAELSVAFETIEQLDDAVRHLRLRLQPVPNEALFRAGKAFLKYRRRGGSKTGVLPDFFIGAHAEVTGLPLLTRDAARYRTYFPDATLIAPENEPSKSGSR